MSRPLTAIEYARVVAAPPAPQGDDPSSQLNPDDIAVVARMRTAFRPEQFDGGRAGGVMNEQVFNALRTGVRPSARIAQGLATARLPYGSTRIKVR